MTPSAPQPTELDPATLADMLRATLASLPVDPDASPEDVAAQRRAALLAVMSLRPRDPMEAMLAARIVSSHHAAMECFRRAAQPDVSDNAALRLRGKAVSLANLATRTQRELQKCQAAPPAYAVAPPPEPEQEQEADRTAPAQAAAAEASPASPPVGAPAPRADAPPAQVADNVAVSRLATAGAIALAA